MDTILWWVKVLLSSVEWTWELSGETPGAIVIGALVLVLSALHRWRKDGWPYVKEHVLRTTIEGVVYALIAFAVVVTLRVPFQAHGEYARATDALADEAKKHQPGGEYATQVVNLQHERDGYKTERDTATGEKKAISDQLTQSNVSLLNCVGDLAKAGLARPIDIRPTLIASQDTKPILHIYRQEIWEDKDHVGLIPIEWWFVPDKPLVGQFALELEADNEIELAHAGVVGVSGEMGGLGFEGRKMNYQVSTPNVTPTTPVRVVLYGKKRILTCKVTWRN